MRGSLGEILIKRYKEVLALKRANAISIALFVFLYWQKNEMEGVYINDYEHNK